jgi:hypothetical protein
MTIGPFDHRGIRIGDFVDLERGRLSRADKTAHGREGEIKDGECRRAARPYGAASE